MAEVFLGHAIGAEGFRRQVAIKRVLPGYAQSPQFAEMFISEARLSSQLQQSNIVAILDFARDEKSGLFLVMEYVDGTSLDGLLKTGLLPIPAVVHVVTEVLRGLEYAHETIMPNGIRGIVHRDVSPHNVLLSHDGGVKIADFGIAKARITSNVTGSEMIKGKPAYMSPEQANGESLDGRSDLFAVGVMLWEMLCGRPLFMGSSLQETLSRLLFAPILSPRQLRSELPPDLEYVTMRLRARELPQRYSSATGAMVDLIACRDYPRSGRELLRGLMRTRLRSDAVPAEIASGARTAVDARRPLPSPSDGRSPRAEAEPNHRRSSRSLLVLILAVGILGTALGLFVASRVNPSVRIVSSTSLDAGSTFVASATDAHAADAVERAPPVIPGKSEAETSLDADPGSNSSVAKSKVRGKRSASVESPPRSKQAPAPQPEVEPIGVPELDQEMIRNTPVQVTVEEIKTTGKLEKERVQKHWLSKIPQIRRCYGEATISMSLYVEGLRWLEGWETLNFSIDSAGTVTKVQACCIHPVLEDCLTAIARQHDFPRPSEGTATVYVRNSIRSCAITKARPCPWSPLSRNP